MTFTDQVLDYATKEHTPAFKRAVEKCKAQNPDKEVGYCFAAITSAFKKANKPIFLAEDGIEGDFAKVLFGESDQLVEEVALAVWTRAYINSLPDAAFAYIADGERKLPYKNKEGEIDKAHLRNALARLKQTSISAEAKRKALRKLIAAARKVGIKVTTELADYEEELQEVLDYHSYENYSDSAFADVLPSLDNEITVELSGTKLKWKSLGHALQVTEELIRPGVFRGIDGKSCRWTESVLAKYHESVLSQPVKTWHEKEGKIRTDIPVDMAGKTVGFVTHTAELAGRVFYKALVYNKIAQELIKSGNFRSSLEAKVALSDPDASGVYDVKAWLSKGVAFTDRPAVKKDNITIDPVALARKNKMTDPSQGDPTPPADPPADPPAQDKDNPVTLSASDLQDLVKSAVKDATVQLSAEFEEFKKDLKKLTDDRDKAELAVISDMEQDIKKWDDKFDSETLYAKDALLKDKKKSLTDFIRGVNKGLELAKAHKPKPTVTLAEDEILKEKDDICMDMYGKPYEEMLAQPVQPANSTPKGGSS